MKKIGIFDKLSDEQKGFLFFGTALAILVAVVIFGVTPLLEEAILAKRKASAWEERLLAVEAYSKIKNVQKLEKRQEKKLLALKLRLPSDLKQEVVMQEVYSEAERFNVKLSSLKQMSTSKNKELSFYLRCKGKYKDVLKFLGAVENEGSLKILHDVEIKGDTKNENLEVVSIVTAYKT